MNKVLVICGPTCVGKTSVSIGLAKAFNGEIINGDSMQVYKEMNIGTAKIKENEKDGVNHHLFDICSINETFSIADFQKLCRDKIEEITSKGKLPIIVGGSGLYLKSAIYDYEFSEHEHKDYGLEEKSSEELYTLLDSLDHTTALTIHPNNKKRVIRALEIYYENNEGKMDINKTQEHKPLYDVLYLGLTRDRKDLYELIDQRVDQMISEGLVDEARYVLENGTSLTALQAIGYKEFKPYLNHEATLEECVYRVKMNTHAFVKRQYTWFNHQVDVKWVSVDNKTKDEILEDSIKLIGGWINA